MLMNDDIDRVYDLRERFPEEFEMIELIYYRYRSSTSLSCCTISQQVVFPEKKTILFFVNFKLTFLLLLKVDHEYSDNKISTKLQMKYKSQLSMVIDKLKQSKKVRFSRIEDYFTSIKIFM
jgi:hypothetical protein